MQDTAENKTIIGTSPNGDKINSVNHVKQWDEVAATLMRKQLAPKGFSEIKVGPFKGRHKSNLDFLSRETVGMCQNISAQLIREYRNRAKAKLSYRYEKLNGRALIVSQKLSDCRFWEFGKKKELQREYAHYRDRCGLLDILIIELDKVEVK
jgi:hypothetical protein